MDCLKNLGPAVKKARVNIMLSQEQLAEKLNITATHVKHIEGGHRFPSVEVLFRLATILNLSLDQLIFDEADNKDFINKKIIALLNACEDNELKIVFDLIQSIIINRI
ncbi:MAG: helix-turn-helix transcriptional regulator [Oscillospiraceae bacterium]|nr:helix-turn-helix transcriptional regulator [Oscillospiraceae bacterium]